MNRQSRSEHFCHNSNTIYSPRTNRFEQDDRTDFATSSSRKLARKRRRSSVRAKGFRTAAGRLSRAPCSNSSNSDLDQISTEKSMMLKIGYIKSAEQANGKTRLGVRVRSQLWARERRPRPESDNILEPIPNYVLAEWQSDSRWWQATIQELALIWVWLLLRISADTFPVSRVLVMLQNSLGCSFQCTLTPKRLRFVIRKLKNFPEKLEFFWKVSDRK